MFILDRLLDQQGYILADGATGTNYFKQGLETGYPPELWNVERPEEVGALHAAFIDAGSQLVLTNSFGGTHHRLRLHEAQHRVGELNHAAARLARVAADAGRDRNGRAVLVAGSIGPTGELFAPMGALDYDDARAAFTEQAEALPRVEPICCGSRRCRRWKRSRRRSTPRHQPVLRWRPA